MRFIAFAYALLFSCGAFSQAINSFQTIFGPDDRRDADMTQRPWNAMGKVRSFADCTGTLVGRDLVITASHCIIDSQTGKHHDGDIYFYPAFANQKNPEKVRVIFTWWGTNNSNGDRYRDWALLKLEQSIGEKYGWLGMTSTSTSSVPKTVSLAGYSWDYKGGDIMGRHLNCNIRNTSMWSGWLYHNCDMSAGASGGALIAAIDGDFHVVGLNVAESDLGNNQDPQHAGQYSDKAANIGIPTATFFDTVVKAQK